MATINQAIQANPLFGRPDWSYVSVLPGPVRGPQPRLAQGTGGQSARSGEAAALPGYVTENSYQPNLYAYEPLNNEQRLQRLPRSIQSGSNGRELIGTFEPHETTVADRFNHQMRSAANWQVETFPPVFRNLLAWQQAMKYRVQSVVAQARPLASADYFLGYQISSEVQGAIGQSTLGNLGSG